MTKRFEYCVVELTSGDADYNIEELIRLGNLGYEACGIINGENIMLFKRAMPAEYEYCTKYAPQTFDDEKFQNWLNRLGQMGWRMCGQDGSWYIFMREKPL